MTGERMTPEQLGRELADAFGGADMDAPPGYELEEDWGEVWHVVSSLDAEPIITNLNSYRDARVDAWTHFAANSHAWAEWILTKARGE